MKQVGRMIIGGFVGFVLAYGLMHIRDMNRSDDIFAYILILVTIGLLIWSIRLYAEVRRIYHTIYTGIEEDQADQRKYQKSSDFSIAVHSAMVLSMITVAVTLTQQSSTYLIIASIVVLIGSLLVGGCTNKVLTYVYPDREMPKVEDAISEDEYLDAMLDTADEGEKFIILQGLYKSHHLMNILLIVGIILATTYSALGEGSQLFSIFAMGAVLIGGNIKYQRAIRNK